MVTARLISHKKTELPSLAALRRGRSVLRNPYKVDITCNPPPASSAVAACDNDEPVCTDIQGYWRCDCTSGTWPVDSESVVIDLGHLNPSLSSLCQSLQTHWYRLTARKLRNCSSVVCRVARNFVARPGHVCQALPALRRTAILPGCTLAVNAQHGAGAMITRSMACWRAESVQYVTHTDAG